MRRRGFLIAVALKGFDGALEMAAGLFVAIMGPLRLYDWVIWSVAPGLENRLGEHASRIVQHGAGQLALSGRFAIFYLLAHGVLKLALAICLLRGRQWIFAPASAILLGFVVLLGWHAAEHGSLGVAALALLDAVTLLLVLDEWRSRARAIL